MRGQIKGLWIRPTKGAVPEPQEALVLVTGEGVEGDHKFGGRRHVSLLFEAGWRAAEADLGHEVDPAGRRANVYLSGAEAGDLVGKTVSLGGATLEIQGILHPCALMEEAATGLEEALKPGARGGVWGLVVEGGTIRPGDHLQV